MVHEGLVFPPETISLSVLERFKTASWKDGFQNDNFVSINSENYYQLRCASKTWWSLLHLRRIKWLHFESIVLIIHPWQAWHQNLKSMSPNREFVHDKKKAIKWNSTVDDYRLRYLPCFNYISVQFKSYLQAITYQNKLWTDLILWLVSKTMCGGKNKWNIHKQQDNGTYTSNKTLP